MPALAAATRKLADNLIEQFAMGEPAALALAVPDQESGSVDGVLKVQCALVGRVASSVSGGSSRELDAVEQLAGAHRGRMFQRKFTHKAS